MQAQDLALFKAALGLTERWQVTSVEFDPATKRLDLGIDFPRGATFCCSECDVAGRGRVTPRRRRGGIWTSLGIRRI